jgi:hypothetical protein
MKTTLTALILGILATATPTAHAQGLPALNAEMVTATPATLRASEPDASFGTKGDKIGWLQEGESVKVLTVVQTMTVFGPEVWIEVSRSNGTKGWMLDGLLGEVMSGHGTLNESATRKLAQK